MSFSVRGMVGAMVKGETQLTASPIVCPHCGNTGQENGLWEANGPTPFRLVEEVVRSWTLEAECDANGTLLLTADTSNEQLDGESGTNLRLECVICFGTFALPDGAEVKFE